ncbi:hypothetical protein WCLP8_5030011 [uncultured Gammaproteobacteria bacterium]
MPQPYFTDPNIGKGFDSLSQALAGRKQSAYDQQHAEIAASEYNARVAAGQELLNSTQGKTGTDLATSLAARTPNYAANALVAGMDPGNAFGYTHGVGVIGGAPEDFAQRLLTARTGRPIEPYQAATPEGQGAQTDLMETNKLANALAMSQQNGGNQMALERLRQSAPGEDRFVKVGEGQTVINPVDGRVVYQAPPKSGAVRTPEDTILSHTKGIEELGKLLDTVHGVAFNPTTKAPTPETDFPPGMRAAIIDRAMVMIASGRYNPSSALLQARQDLMHQVPATHWFGPDTQAWSARPEHEVVNPDQNSLSAALRGGPSATAPTQRQPAASQTAPQASALPPTPAGTLPPAQRGDPKLKPGWYQAPSGAAYFDGKGWRR